VRGCNHRTYEANILLKLPLFNTEKLNLLFLEPHHSWQQFSNDFSQIKFSQTLIVKMKSKLVNFKNLNIQSDPFNDQTANNIFQSADKLSSFLV
jgi:hypothetical protein